MHRCVRNKVSLDKLSYNVKCIKEFCLEFLEQILHVEAAHPEPVLDTPLGYCGHFCNRQALTFFYLSP